MLLAALLEQKKQIYQLNMIRLKISVELGSTEKLLQQWSEQPLGHATSVTHRGTLTR